MQNSIVSALSFESDEIRTTNDGRISLYDFIRVVGGQKSPHEVWKRLCEQYSEYSHILSDYSFGGKGGAAKKTIVITKEETLQILSTLPGVAGKKYRQEAAKLVLAFLDAPAELAIAAIDRIEDESDLKRVKARIDAKVSNKNLNAAIQSAGGSCFAAVANINNIAILGGTAKQIQLARGVKKTRDGLTASELSMLNATEIHEQQAIEFSLDRGDNAIIAKCKTIAEIMAEANRSILALSR
jgi:hypothetical protein